MQLRVNCSDQLSYRGKAALACGTLYLAWMRLKGKRIPPAHKVRNTAGWHSFSEQNLALDCLFGVRTLTSL
jgi:hypothetical protein